MIYFTPAPLYCQPFFVLFFQLLLQTDAISKKFNPEGRKTNIVTEKYYAELTLQLKKAGFEPLTSSEVGLPINWCGVRLGQVIGDGRLQYKSGQLADTIINPIYSRAYNIVKAIAEYMALMKTAPQIKARGLEGDYRVLAEFNSVVLVGHPTRYGVQFVTWEWVQDHTSLWQGHYTESYTAAKEDFATRSGLVEKERQFSDQQLAVIFDAVQHMMVLELTSNPEQDKLLKQIMAQIETSLPEVIDLANALTEDPKMHQLEQMDSIT